MKVDVSGAIVVLQNYLDGAVADFEDGQVDNVDFILSTIEGLKILDNVNYKWSSLIQNEYEKRVKDVLKKQNKK